MDIWMDDTALVEDFGAQRFVYGRWDAEFGFWIWQKEKGVKQCIPMWPIMDRNGELVISRQYCDPEEWCSSPTSQADSNEESLPKVCRPQHFQNEARHTSTFTTFDAYLKTIPLDVRELTAPFQKWQWAILLGLKRVPDFKSFVETELRNHGPNYMGACLEFSSRTLQKNSSYLPVLIDKIMHQKRFELLEQLTGLEWSTQTLKCLEKIHPSPGEDTIREMHQHLEPAPPLRSALVKAKAIPLEAFEVLSGHDTELADLLITPQTLAALSNPEVVDRLEELSCHLLADVSKQLQQDAKKSMSTARTENDILDRCEKLIRKSLALSPFPEPPILPGDNLKPISSFADLRKEARDMQNCLGSSRFLESALQGKRYYCRWLGKERATVELVKDVNSWDTRRIKGFDNTEVSPQTKKAIKLEFTKLVSNKAVGDGKIALN